MIFQLKFSTISLTFSGRQQSGAPHIAQPREDIPQLQQFPAGCLKAEAQARLEGNR